MQLPFLTADDVLSALRPSEAVRALETALVSGLDPARTGERSSVDWGGGQLLLMPAHTAADAGVKILTVAPPDVPPDVPRVNGVYVLFDGATLVPTAVMDGAAITTLRTPAVSWVPVHERLRGRLPLRVTVFGGGPQAVAHIAALEDLLGVEAIGDVTFVVRSLAPGTASLRSAVTVVASGTDAGRRAVRGADVVVCATTSATPLFADDDIRADAVVVAVGSHQADRRELPSPLMGRAQVVVEDRATALREAGDVVLAVADGSLAAADLVPMADVVTGAVELVRDRPVVVKTTGMPWEDLVVAGAVLRAHAG